MINIIFIITYVHIMYSRYFTNHDKRRWQQQRCWAQLTVILYEIGKTRFKRRSNTDKLTIKTYNIFQRYLIAIIIYLAPIIWWHVLYHVHRGPHRTRVMVGNLSLYIATIYIICIIHIIYTQYNIIYIHVYSILAHTALYTTGCSALGQRRRVFISPPCTLYYCKIYHIHIYVGTRRGVAYR